MNIQTPLIQKLYSQCSSAIAAYCFFEKKPAIDEMIENVPITEMGPLGKYLNDEFTEEDGKNFVLGILFIK